MRIYNILKIGTLLVVIFSLLSCTTSKQGADQKSKGLKGESSDLSHIKKKELEDIRNEITLGRTVAGKLIAAFGLYDNKKVNEYLTILGQSVANNSDAPNRKFTFSILNTSHVNAYSAPGGYIFITRGAILQARNEAELAAILGHEIAHVTKSHVYGEIKALKAKEEKKSKELKIRERPSEKDQPGEEGGVQTALSKIIVGTGGTAAVAIFKAMVVAAYDMLVNKGLDQKYEYEADQVGVQYALRSGYSPHALTNYLKRIAKNKKHRHLSRQNKTHPSFSKRIGTLEKYIKTNNLAMLSNKDGKKRFKRIKALIK